MKKMILIIAIISTLLAFLWSGIRIYKAINFDINCTGHLKRAADSNTIELAKNEIFIALKYLENQNLTHGTVSIILKQPKNDIGFWYTNLKASYNELENINKNATQLEKTNILIKLRETLIDNGEELNVTCPNGISIYPFNLIYFIFGFLTCFFSFLFWTMFLSEIIEHI